MHYIAENLKALRKEKGWTQSEFARQLGVKRSLIGAYEEGRADPRISFLQLICEKFGLTMDKLITRPIGEQSGNPVTDVRGSSLRVLPITIDREKKAEMAALVPVQAAAGYMTGYGDVEYIESLPVFDLPFPELTRGRTYRLFQIRGESMLPIPPKSYIICSYVMDWTSIRNDQCYVILGKSEGIVFKRVLNNLALGYLTLKSDNPEFETYNLPVEEILEVWQAEGSVYLGTDHKEYIASPNAVMAELGEIRKRLDELGSRITDT